ncbi:7068_t:CDS:2 [Entrophospora sp. SA101]|nr:7068_t:CDS:2 [Entrophospora sp. SA101]
MLPEKQILAHSTLHKIMVYPDGVYIYKVPLRSKINQNYLSENERLTKKVESITSKKRILAIKLKKQE